MLWKLKPCLLDTKKVSTTLTHILYLIFIGLVTIRTKALLTPITSFISEYLSLYPLPTKNGKTMDQNNITKNMEKTTARFERLSKEMVDYLENATKGLRDSDRYMMEKEVSDELGRLLGELDNQCIDYIRAAQRFLNDVKWMKIKARCQIVKAKSEIDKKIARNIQHDAA